MIDSNVHLILTTVPKFYLRYEEDLVDIALQSAQVKLKYGMTTMADSWGPLEPLIDIGNLLSIHMVIKDGRIVDRNALPTRRILDYDPEAPWPY